MDNVAANPNPEPAGAARLPRRSLTAPPSRSKLGPVPQPVNDQGANNDDNKSKGDMKPWRIVSASLPPDLALDVRRYSAIALRLGGAFVFFGLIT